MKKITTYTICALLFFLPWQTRWIFWPVYVNGIFFEYGSRALYGTGILLILVIIFLVVDFLWKKDWWAKLSGPDYFNFSLAFWAGGVVQGLFAVIQFLTQHIGANKWLGLAEHNARDLGASVIEFGDERWLRAYGAFGSPNSLGIYLAIILVVGFLLYRHFIADASLAVSPLRRGRIRGGSSLAITAGQLTIASGLALSFSRAAWLAAVIGCTVLFYFSAKTDRKILLKQFTYILLVFIILFALFPKLFTTRVTAEGRLEQKSITERQTQLSDWTKIAGTNVFSGTGYGHYTNAVMTLHPNLPAYDYQPVHNIYLLMLAELGLPLFLSIIILIGIGIRLVYLRHPENLAIIATWLAAGMFDHWLWTMFSGLLLSLVVWFLASKKPLE
ncbi:MAG: O-antigen ligase family protein [bacterium]|nr:O-antigen ligase family protein [bacterium]